MDPQHIVFEEITQSRPERPSLSTVQKQEIDPAEQDTDIDLSQTRSRPQVISIVDLVSPQSSLESPKSPSFVELESTQPDAQFDFSLNPIQPSPPAPYSPTEITFDSLSPANRRVADEELPFAPPTPDHMYSIASIQTPSVVSKSRGIQIFDNQPQLQQKQPVTTAGKHDSCPNLLDDDLLM